MLRVQKKGFSENANNPQLDELGEVLTLEVKDVNNLSDAEEAQRNEVMGILGTEGNVSTLIITDGENSRRIYVDSNPGTLPPPPPPPSPKSANGLGVPFTVIENVPIFPGCEALASNEEKKKCMTEKISEFVRSNFDTAGMKAFAKKGINRINVQFLINTSGNIEVIGVRGSSPELEAEARRVIEKLPKMIPGKQNGKETGVLYAMPISFQI